MRHHLLMTKRRLTKLTVTKVRLIRRSTIGRHCFRFNRIPRLFSYPPSPLELIIPVNESIVRRNTSIFRYEVRMILRIIAISLISPRLRESLVGFLFDCYSRFDLLLLFSISRANRIKEQKDGFISISAEFTSFRVLENRDLSSLSLLSLLLRVFRAPSRNEKELSPLDFNPGHA